VQWIGLKSPKILIKADAEHLLTPENHKMTDASLLLLLVSKIAFVLSLLSLFPLFFAVGIFFALDWGLGYLIVSTSANAK
jgi:hypothetical protein